MGTVALPFVRIVLLAAGLGVWRGSRAGAPTITPGVIYGLAGVAFGAELATQWAYAHHRDPIFEPVGFTSSLGTLAVLAAVVVMLAAAGARKLTLALFLALQIGWKLLWLVCYFGTNATQRFVTDATFETIGSVMAIVVAWGLPLWFLGAAYRGLAWVEGTESWAVRGRALLMTALVGGVGFILPQTWVFEAHGRSPVARTVWSLRPAPAAAPAAPTDPHEIIRGQIAALEMRQAPLLTQSLDRLQPRAPKQANVYILGLAGDMTAPAFERESDQATGILARRFGAGGHVVRLSNSLETTARLPIASRQNFALAVLGIAQRMDLARDLLIISVASHGMKEGIILDMGDLASGPLTPAQMKETLDRAGIRNRLLIISTCYSGIYIPVLRTETTAILTATASDRTSFGCTAQPDWTHFGRALFEQGLGRQGNLVDAFAVAARQIAEREAAEWFPNSEPQIDVGSALPGLFPAIFGPPATARTTVRAVASK